MEIRTVHVFPEEVSGYGWENLETITFQNLDGLSLYQEFNQINSAYPNEKYRNQLLKKRSAEDDTQSSVIQVPETITSEAEVIDRSEAQTATTSTSTSVTATTSAEVIDEIIPAVEEEVVEFATTSVPVESEIENEPEVESEQATSSVVLRQIDQAFTYLFAVVTDALPFVVGETETSTESVTDPDPPEIEVVTEPVVEEISSTTEESVGEDGLIVDEVVEVEPVSEISTTTEPAATSSPVIEEESTEPATSTASTTEPTVVTNPIVPVNDPGSEVSVSEPEDMPCTEECVPYEITLGGFSVPIFDEQTEFAGAQLRMSFAAKRKETRDEVQSLQVLYSLDNGVTWVDNGQIIIDEEASNSLNGGYFLFSLPRTDNPALLDALEIKLVYDENPADLEDIFIDSVWLEMFVTEVPDLFELSTMELNADDGYTYELLTGDALALPDGSEIEFEYTDENSGETLIIKSDQLLYDGLSEITTYFNVTNISNNDDTFTLNTYFPTGVGEVMELEQWNKNKPKNIVVPEYRPFVYHCESGWEVTENPVGQSLEAISRQLAEPTNVESGGTVGTSSVSDSIPSVTTTTEPVLLDEEKVDEVTATSTSETVEFELASTSLPLTQATFDQATSASPTSVLPFVLSELESSATSTNNYICRDTSVVRTCDALEGDNTSCRLDNIKVREHELTRYEGGWEETAIGEGVPEDTRGFFKQVTDFLGFGPEKKSVPPEFETRAHSDDSYTIEAGETQYFKMTIKVPPFSRGEFWIEAIGDSEYGLLDPFWSSQWQYRLPITVDNTAGSSVLTEHQVFLELDSSLTDFWSNVNDSGSDIRLIQETTVGNEEDWYGTGWGRRAAITIQASQVNETVTNFPVYVNLADLGPTFFSSVQSDGDDIRVTTADGVTELPYDLVAINTGGGSGEMHFRADSVSSTTNTTFYIYHDNPNVNGYSATDTYGSENVWTNNFLAVYHLEEDAAGTGNTGLYVDSTSNNEDADDEINATGKTGQLGNGQEILGRNTVPDDHISVPNTVLDTETNVTISYWFESAITGNQALVSGGSGNELLLWQQDGQMQPYAGGAGPVFTYTNTNDGDFHFMTVVRNDTANEWEVFVDGQSAGGPQADTLGALSIPSGCLLIGQEQDSPCPTNTDASQAYEGFIDELVFSDALRSAGWISTTFRNQSTSTDFYATSTETFMTTTFSELDHWVQYFSTTTDEADIWVQVDSLAASASTTIYLYYGNTAASSVSDEYTPFTYSTTTDLYYVVSDLQTNPIVVYSLIDGNEVSIDGGTAVSLDSGETTSFATYSSSSVISALGPITARTSDQSSEPPAPIAFATTTHITPTNRGVEDFYVHAPFATASVDVFNGGAIPEAASGTVPSGATVQFDADISGGSVGIVESDEPVLVFQERATGDSYVSYLPTTRDLYGIYSTDYQYATFIGGASVEIYCSDGNSGTTTGMTRGGEEADDYCNAAGNGNGLGPSVRITSSTAPIGAVQEADGDGGESTRFLPTPEFGTRYVLPQTTEYVTIACSPRFAAADIEVQTVDGTPVDTGTCTPNSSLHPGALNFTPGTAYTAGHQVVSTNNVPFYMYYEDNGTGDETNTWSAVQARKFESLDTLPYSFGAQEINIDAEYEQLSFTWYQNGDAETPTTTWSLGDDGNVSEGEAITGQGAISDGDVLRLRMNLLANTATGSASSSAFQLQYAVAETCSTATEWFEIGKVGSTTAAFSGYDNASINDGVTLSSTTLASSTVFATYEEASLSEFIPNQIPPGDVAEWDWVITSSNAQVNTNYCFRMTRSSGDALVTYTEYPQLLTSGPPGAATLIKRFDNEHATSVRPTLEFFASDLSGDALHYQVQVATNTVFAPTVLDQNSADSPDFQQFENIPVPSNKPPFNSGQLIRYTPPSDLTSSTTYWWRVRSIDPDGSNTYSDWSTPFSFTINESLAVSEWFQTTDEQFETNSLISATTSGSGSIELDIGGGSDIGEYGSITVTNGATTTVNLFHTYTNPVVTASVEYSRTVPDGDQPMARVSNKTGTSFDVLSDDFTFDAPGTSTVHYVVMEAGEYLMDDGANGLRVFATSTSVSGYAGANISGDPGLDITFPTAFSGAPAVLTMVTTVNDPQWVVAATYDGNSIANEPTASQMGVYLTDHIASDGHGSAEDIDIIVFDVGDGTNNSVLFDIFLTGITTAYVDNTADTFTFNAAFSAAPGVTAVGQLGMNGAQGSYAMVDIDTPVTATTIDLAVDEGGTNGARTHADENVSVVAFESATGTIIRAGNAQITSTAIDFDDAEVGNAWGEVSFTDSGDVTYHIEYQTGGGFSDIPDSALAGNSTGFTTSPINILDLDTDVYNEIRLVAVMTGVSPELFDWTVTWGQRVEIPNLGDPFDNEKVPTTTPTFDFVATDPQGDDLEYEISWSTDDEFLTSSTTRNSSTSANFANLTTPADTDPFNSGDTITYTIQPGEALTNNTTYWWRVRARDPNGGNSFSPWSEPDSFTVDNSTTVSTWFQTTQEQFEEGTLDGAIASSSDSVVITTQVGEYGTTTVTNNNWNTVTTTQTYNNMVVVASPEYAFNGTNNGRTVQVRNKTSNTFQIKADNYTESLSGTTSVDYIVMEAGDWNISDGGSGTRIVAGTASGVSTVKGSSPGYTGGTQISFNPNFSTPPAVLATVSTNNGNKWVGTVVDDGTQTGEATAAAMNLALGVSLDTDTVRDAEDIDYLAMEIATGTNNGVLFDAFNTADAITESDTEATTTFAQAFSSAPEVIVVQNNGTHGADGGFAQVDLDTPTTPTFVYLSIAEMGASAGNHATEIVSLIAFESETGNIRRESTTSGGLTGTIGSEPILFSDGAGPKFERALFATTSPGNSSTTVQVQYLSGTSTWILIPDSQIPGNSVGTTTSPIDLTNVDIVAYPTIRLFATLMCDLALCPTLEDWTVEWSEGVPVSGTIAEYDRSTAVTSGTVQVAVNGVPGNTGTIAGDGTWTINNVTAFDGDTVTVWVNGAAEEDEAVAVFVYDGIGDMTGVQLYEQHLSLSADENGTTTNARIGAYDNSVSSNEDIFFDVNDITEDLTVCSTGSCVYANLYVGSGDIYVPHATSSGDVTTHDFVNDGAVEFDGNTVRVSGSWDNNGTFAPDTSTVILTATSTSETLDDTDNILDFNNLTFGETSGTATWQTFDPVDLEGALSVDHGTFNRASSTITVGGALTTNGAGFWSGISTTTFDGSTGVAWVDNNAVKQNAGNVVIDGSAKVVTLSTDVAANTMTIAANDTLNAGGANTLFLYGNFTNNNVFTAQTGTIAIIGTSTQAVINTGGSSLYNLTASTTGTGTVAFTNANVVMLGDLTIATGTVTLPTATTSIGGSFSNTGGTFLHNNAEVRFTGSGSETIEQQADAFLNHFYDVTFTGTGDWTFLDTNATTSRNFMITNGNVLLPTGSLTVGGDYTTSGGGSFEHRNGEVILLIQDADTVTTNGSNFNDVRVREAGASGAWYDANWQYRLPITIRATEIDDDLTNFPVYVDLSDFPAAFFSNLNSDGGDIRVTGSDATTEVPREIVSASTTAQTGEMHFRATSLSSTTDTTFYLYYGNSGASDYSDSDTFGAENVWTNNFLAVYHLEEDSAGTGNSGVYIDSTSNGEDGDDEINATGKTGQVGSGQEILGRNAVPDDHISLPNTVLDSETDVTISYWFESSITANQALVSGGASNEILLWQTPTTMQPFAGGGGPTFTYTTTDDGDFHLMTVVRDDTTNEWEVFVDGASVGARQSDTLGALSISAGCLLIGQEQDSPCPTNTDAGQAFEGFIDELVFASGIRSDEWIAATYRNQSTTTDFYAAGSVPQQESVRTFSGTNVTALGDVTIESGQTVFPSGTFSVGGSFDNNDRFDSNSGVVSFIATTSSETIAVGSSTFYTLDVNGPGGNVTITEHATATNDINLLDINVFTVNSGLTLESTGMFSSDLVNASTTWTGAELRLSSGTDFAINTKDNAGDAYNLITTTADTDISMWNSSASTYNTLASSSIYSQDHSATGGDLYIFGDYARESGTEYWSYATDFDGVDLVASSTERQVDVRVANGAFVRASTSVLEIVGTSTASTTVDAQSGSFTLLTNQATVTAQYFSMTGTDADGFQLLSSTTVTSLDDALFTILSSSAAITVDASTVDTNPASQFFDTNFVTGGGNVNVTKVGSPTSFWWFRDGQGDRYGEAFDNADGDPGEIRWDDSSFDISISGVIYSDDGTTTMGGPTCDGSTENVRVVVNGGTFSTTTSCSGVDGTYSFPSVSYIGDPSIVVYLDTNGGDDGAVITRTPTANITNLDVYGNRVMTRHEDSAPLTIAQIAVYDESDDTDLRFVAATGTTDTFTVRQDTELYVFATTTFNPGGVVTLESGGTGNTYDGSLHLGASSTFVGVGTTTYSVGGSIILEPSADLITASSTFLMTATTSGKTITASSTIDFNELQFTGVSGGWNINTDITAAADINVATGTVTGTGDITLTNGSFYGDGLVSLGGGTTLIHSSSTLGGTQGWTFNNLTLGNGSVNGTTTPGSNATTTVGGVLTISAGHILDAGGSGWNLTGSGNVFVETGTFNEGTSAVQYGGTSNANVLSTTYYNLYANAADGAPTFTAQSTGFQILNNLRVGGASTTSFTLDANDPTVAIAGDVFIDSNGTFVGSSANTLTVSGSWDNNGTYTGANGLVDFDSADAFSIAAGSSSFSNVLISAAGAATVSENATSTGDWTLATTSDFTVSVGQRLAVGNQFTNGGGATTWTGSTLHLFGSGAFDINASTTQDTYATLSAAAGTHIRMWNSSSTVYTTASGGSIYSMDHRDTVGDLYIFGDYVLGADTDHWSYNTDFDGGTLSTPRQVEVFVENGGSFSVGGGSLQILGTTSASTTIEVTGGSGTYSADVTSGTINAQYYTIQDMDSDGLTFTGSPTVTTLSNGEFIIGPDNARGMTIAGSVIDANPAKNYVNNRFATTSGTSVAVNASTTGSTVSSWRFTTHYGDIDGESFDADNGDPGYLVWDDSAAIITISGNIYENNESSVSSVCDDATTNIVLAVDGVVTPAASSSCASADGSYSISGISFSPNDTLTLFIDGEADQGATVSIDPISSIGNMDIYEDHVIVRHEGADPILNADLADFDGSAPGSFDSDIPFDVSGSDVTIDPDFKLIIWDSKEYEPQGDITTGGGGGGVLDGTVELQDDATLTLANSETHSFGGSLEAGTGAIFTSAQSTVTFTSSGSGRTIDTNESGFYDLVINGTGSYSSSDTVLTVANDLTLTNGALTLPAATTTITGSLSTTGGSFDANSGLVVFNSTVAETITTAGSDFNELTFNGSGSWSMNDTNATATASVIVEQGTVTLPSGSITTLGDFRNTGGTVTHNTTNLIMATSGVATLLASGSDLYEVTIRNGVFTVEDNSLTFLHDFTIFGATTTLASGTLSIGGSFDAGSGSFNNATGSILFNSTDTGETVDPGDNDFYNVVFGSGSGGWTLTADATTTNNFSLSAANSFTLQSGSRLYVGNVFTNSVGGGATTWTNTTLVLDPNAAYTINTKSAGGDDYETLEIGFGSDIRAWDSRATTTVVAASSSLYSQDHGGANGDLYIYGDFGIATGTEYWSYQTDFDGTALGGSPRQVNVYHATSATTTVSGGTLEIIGVAAASSTVQNQGSGNYAFEVNAGTLNASYYSFRDLDGNGVVLTGVPTITSLSNGDFELAVNGGSLITLSSSTLSVNPSKFIDDVRFATTTVITGNNVNLNATTATAWTFRDHYGNLSGENYDVDGIDNCGSIRWDDSSCLLVEQTHYRWRNDDGGLGAPDSSWFSASWGKRQSVRVVNNDSTSYATTVVKMTVTHDSDMQGDFEDLRFTGPDGVTEIPYWIERFTASTDATVWIQIPSLVGNDSYYTYMYYDNVSATTTSSSTEVFIAVDDFEDNNISEYSGDTGKFQTEAASAFGGSYGVGPVTDTDFTNDGIARFDLASTSQGQIIRYMQYVDTSGTNDEACTLFGVQSPVTDNNNYAVCLELFGVDRISLVRDAERSDNFGGVVMMASSTVAYTTGWYEVEIDWQTDNTIDVSLFNSAGTLVATTSSSSPDYTSGGLGFTYWGQTGGWDSYVTRNRTDSMPSVFFGGEQVDGGATWNAVLDDSSNNIEIGDIARLRFAIENSGLAITDQEFQLEYAAKGAAPSCESVSAGSYAAVPVDASCGSSPMCMATSSNFADGDAIADLLTDTNGTFVTGEATEDPANTADSLDIAQNEYTELEYAFRATVNATDSAYCLRVTDAGTELDSYASVAEFALQFAPVMGTVSFNLGNDISLVGGTTTRVYATTSVIDLNGFGDLQLATSTMYTTSATAACAANDNDCYVETIASSCSFIDCAVNTCTLSCYADFQFHATPTDSNGGEFWQAFLEVEDSQGGTDFGTSPAVDVQTLNALDVFSDINYGSLAVASDTAAFNPTTTIQNIGNNALDINLDGTDLTDSASSSIPTDQQLFATSSFTYSACTVCTVMSTSTISSYELDLNKPTTTASNVEDIVYWGIAIPFGTASNPHSGVNTFYAVSD